jgi:hypothetical protein
MADRGLVIGLLLITLLIEFPIYFYLCYWLISHSNPDRLIWVLFWVYVPLSIILNVIWRIIKEKD